MADWKKIFFLFLLIVFIFQASSAFALEIKYPPLPGAIPPQEIEKQPQDERLPLYINYFLRLFFIIAISIAITVIIYGGVLYLISGAKPAVMVTARTWISQGLLGLLILTCSYLILAVINPQLLVFKFKAPPKLGVPSLITPVPTQQATFLQIPLGALLEKTLDDLDETTTTKWGEVHRIEVPLLEIIDTLSEAVVLTKEIKDELEKCKCGESKYHIEFSGLKGKCVGGVTKEDEKSFWEAIWEEIGEEIKGGQNVCKTRCKDCGSACNLEDIKKEGGKRERLQKLLAELHGQKIKLSTEQMSLIEKTLGGNAGNFLISQLIGVSFQEDFLSQKEALESQGYEVELERPKQFPQAQTVTMSPVSYDPFTFYAPLEGEIIPREIARENQRIYRESQRASLFAVLTRLSLEDIEQMIQDCLSSAFGQGEFMIDPDELLDIIEKAILEGLADYLADVLPENSSEFAEAFLKKLQEGMAEDVSDKETYRIDQCNIECQNEGFTMEQCNEKCKPENAIPPYFLSNKLAEFLTADLREHLPVEIQRILSERLREFIFSRELNQILSTDIIKLLDGVLQGALSKSLEDQIPLLRENLQKRMIEILPLLILDPLQTVDAFLAKHLKDLKKRIDAQIGDLVMTLGLKLSQPASVLIDSYREDHPDLFTENLPREQCRASDGRYYDDDLEKCITPTPEQINDNWESTIQGEKAGWVDKPTFCRSYAGYDWDPVGQECIEGKWIDAEGLKPTRENLKKWGREFLAGLVNFGEQFLVALTQTSIYTLTKYAQVWVEDEILAPLQPYLQQLTIFQKKLHQFLYATIKDLLPRQLVSYLESNIDQILKKLCQGRDIELYQGMEPIVIDSTLRENACEINRELHQDLLEQLADTGDLGLEIANALNTTVFNLLPEDYQDILNRSFAEILWPGVTNIVELVKGTPKEFICGELMADYHPDTVKTIAGQQSIFDKCQDLRTTERTAGLLPYLDQTDPLWGGMSEEKREDYLRHCYFIWYACENPFSGWNQTIGRVIKRLLTSECNRANEKVVDECDGVSCYAGCEQDLPNNLEFECESCKVLVRNSVAFTLFKYAVEENYGLIEPVDERTEEEIGEELETYQWLVVVFPDPDLRNDVDRLAKERDLWQEWAVLPTPDDSLRQEAIDADKLNDLPLWQQKGEDFAKAFVAWFTEERHVYDILTYPSFGIMRYLRGEDYMGRNFLSKTPYQLLYNELCRKVKIDFREDYPAWTIEAIKIKEIMELRPILPYSMEALELPITTAEALEILLSLPESEVTWDRREQYLSCALLDYKPAEILGLDQNLIRYVRPKEYQILFALIKDKLKPIERPEALNMLLTYLYGWTPVNLLWQIGDDLGDEDMKGFAVFLNTKIGDQINQGPMAEQIIVLIFRALGLEDLLYQRLGWEEWRQLQEFLKQKPVDLIEAYLSQQLIGNNIIGAASIMERIAQNSILGQPYVDTLGRVLHLTEPIHEFFVTKEEFDARVDGAVRHTRGEIQNTFDEILIEYPKAGLNWLARTLGQIIGIELGEKTADQLAGVCRIATTEERLNEECTTTDEVFKKEAQECCSLGEGLVCVTKCREAESEEDCKIAEGEIFNGVTNECCFDEECRKCREPKTTNGIIKCEREGEQKITRDSQELCCKERIVKDDLCCVNVMQCIVDKFTFHLELLGDALIDGPSLDKLR